MPSWTYLGVLGTLFLGYFGALGNFKVLGLLNCTEVRTLRLRLLCTPLSTFFLAFDALATAFGWSPPDDLALVASVLAAGFLVAS